MNKFSLNKFKDRSTHIMIRKKKLLRPTRNLQMLQKGALSLSAHGNSSCCGCWAGQQKNRSQKLGRGNNNAISQFRSRRRGWRESLTYHFQGKIPYLLFPLLQNYPFPAKMFWLHSKALLEASLRTC